MLHNIFDSTACLTAPFLRLILLILIYLVSRPKFIIIIDALLVMSKVDVEDIFL